MNLTVDILIESVYIDLINYKGTHYEKHAY